MVDYKLCNLCSRRCEAGKLSGLPCDPVAMKTKICTKCNIDKPYDRYSKKSKGSYWLRSECKECRNTSSREYYNNNNNNKRR